MKFWTINKVLLAVVLLLFSTFIAYSTGQGSTAITLTPSNHIMFKGEVNGEMVSKTINKIMNVKQKYVYMFISSPGGDLFTGGQLVDFLKTTDKKVVCITDYAASMAFIVFQHCHRRYVMESSVLMQHEATIGIRDSMSKFHSMLSMIEDMIYHIDVSTADRMGLNYWQYRAKVQHDWWIYGAMAVKFNAADRIVKVKCSKKLIKSTYSQKIQTLFQTATVTWSKCPLLSYPVKINGAKTLFHESIDLNRDNWAAETIKKINIPFLK